MTVRGDEDDVFNSLSMRHTLKVGGPEVGYHDISLGVFGIVLVPKKMCRPWNGDTVVVVMTYVITSMGVGWMRETDLQLVGDP